ncbi:type II secretion system protein N [Kistimonas asteriae]|uniref:type II secretion system protein N n=1 Tax=Kistimonas asteriae TaxID=517724 RepID=UPI001BA82E5D|nr:type II secretion system protein N [Kistimonas asteriae]
MDKLRVLAGKRGMFLAGLLVAGMVARFSFSAYQYSSLTEPVALGVADVDPSSITLPGSQNIVDLQVMNLNLFGAYQESEDSAPVQDELPDTELKLTLDAVFYSGEQQGAAALISGSDQSGLYHVGDRLAQGIVLKAIAPNVVTIEREGRLENIRFSRFEEVHEKVIAKAPRPQAISKVAQSQTESVAMAGVESLQEKLQALRDRYAAN